MLIPPLSVNPILPVSIEEHISATEPPLINETLRSKPRLLQLILTVNNLLTGVGQNKQLQAVQGKDFRIRIPNCGGLTDTQDTQVYWLEKLPWKTRASTKHNPLPAALAKHSQTPRF